MIKLFGEKVSREQLSRIRDALGLKGATWCQRAETSELLRCAFPRLQEREIGKEVESFNKLGKFLTEPEWPQEIYKSYKKEYGCSLPFDCEKTVKSSVPAKVEKVEEPKMTVKNGDIENEDVINHPKHYTAENVMLEIEPISLCEQCDFLLGNAFKYMFRYEHKGKPLEDLRKARFYLRRWLENHENGEGHLMVPDMDNYIFKAFSKKWFLETWQKGYSSANVINTLAVLEVRIKKLEDICKQ